MHTRKHRGSLFLGHLPASIGTAQVWLTTQSPSVTQAIGGSQSSLSQHQLQIISWLRLSINYHIDLRENKFSLLFPVF